MSCDNPHKYGDATLSDVRTPEDEALADSIIAQRAAAIKKAHMDAVKAGTETPRCDVKKTPRNGPMNGAGVLRGRRAGRQGGRHD